MQKKFSHEKTRQLETEGDKVYFWTQSVYLVLHTTRLNIHSKKTTVVNTLVTHAQKMWIFSAQPTLEKNEKGEI